MKISDAIEADLDFARKCELRSTEELVILLNGTKDRSEEFAVDFLKSRYASASEITSLEQRELVQSICNLYLYVLGKPEKEKNDQSL